MDETQYLSQGQNGKKLRESIEQIKEIKEIERLMMIHDDLYEKKKKIERLIKENYTTTIDLDIEKIRCDKLIQGNLEGIKVLTQKLNNNEFVVDHNAKSYIGGADGRIGGEAPSSSPRDKLGLNAP